jgi:hypothetical protein
MHNRPDIVVFDKLKKKLQLIDIAISLSVNMQKVYTETCKDVSLDVTNLTSSVTTCCIT